MITIDEAEFGAYYKDAKVISDESDYRLSMYGLSDEAKIEKINGVNYLKEVTSDEDGEGIVYLGTTGTC